MEFRERLKLVERISKDLDILDVADHPEDFVNSSLDPNDERNGVRRMYDVDTADPAAVQAVRARVDAQQDASVLLEAWERATIGIAARLQAVLTHVGETLEDEDEDDDWWLEEAQGDLERSTKIRRQLDRVYAAYKAAPGYTQDSGDVSNALQAVNSPEALQLVEDLREQVREVEADMAAGDADSDEIIDLTEAARPQSQCVVCGRGIGIDGASRVL